MDQADWLTEQFEASRQRLRAIAHRMLGSVAEADDAVQEAWLRLDRVDATSLDNLGGWLTTVVARVCLDRLRSRVARREAPAGLRLAAEMGRIAADNDPEQQGARVSPLGFRSAFPTMHAPSGSRTPRRASPRVRTWFRRGRRRMFSFRGR